MTDGIDTTAGNDSAATERLKAGGSYSRFVGWMRITLPVIACVIVVLIVAWPQLQKAPDKFRLGVSSTTILDTGGQEVVNPRYTGIDKNNRPFTVTADTASPQQDQPQLISLSFPKADITTQNGAWLALSAQAGRYNRNSEELDLNGAVDLFHDTGHEIRTSKARIFLKKGMASGNDDVEGHGPVGTVRSKGFLILEKGDRLIFTGKARLVLYPSARKEKG